MGINATLNVLGSLQANIAFLTPGGRPRIPHEPIVTESRVGTIANQL